MKMIPRTAIPVGNREIAVLIEALLSGNALRGQQVEEFEREFAHYLGVGRAYAFNSGRTALSVALQALELEREAEVLVPAYTCAIVFEVVLRLGLRVVAVDVDPETYNINPDLISKSITPNARAIVPIHLFGQPCQMDKIIQIAEKYGLNVIEDVAQALGATYKQRKVGTFGDMSIFSFGPGKSITSGQGGALVINNPQLEDKVAQLQVQLKMPDSDWNLTLIRNVLAMKMFSKQHLYKTIRGRLEESLLKDDEAIVENCMRLIHQGKSAAVNPTVKMAKMPAFSAEIAKTQLKRIDSLNEKRRTNAAELSALLAGSEHFISLPRTYDGLEHTFTRYTTRVLKGPRETLMARLLKRGIDTERPYFYLPKVLRAMKAESPVAIALSQSALTLPNHPLIKSSDIVKIATAVTSELKFNPRGKSNN